MEEFFSIFYGKWSNKQTLYKLLFYVVISYYTLMSFLFGDSFNKTAILNLIILLVVLIFIIIYWKISTNRTPIVLNKKLKIALLINIDDENIENRIEKIINETILELNSNSKDDIHFILLPINIFNDDARIKKYLDNAGTNIDTLLWIKFSSGNELNENISYEKMNVDFLRSFSRVPLEKNIKLFSQEINLINDIRISNYHKNWEYIEANSKHDKKRIKINLFDIILQYASIYYIYVGQFEKSLKYLTIVQNNKADEIVNKNKNIYKIKKFNQIILDLFFKIASKYYFDEKNYVKCYEILDKASLIITEKSKFFFDLNLNLAIVSYRNNKLDKAIHHTEILRKISPISSSVFLNFGFFSILKNDSEGLYKNYKNLKLRHRKIKEIDMLEVLSFLCEEQVKFIENDNKILFDFAIGFITISYIDYDEGLKIVEDFIDNYSDLNNGNANLLELANSCIKRKLTA